MRKLLVFILFSWVALSSSADVLKIGISNQGNVAIEKPAKGLSLLEVEQKFGQPAQKFEPKGNPPITRWQYDNFSVYFEGSYVIHSVIHHVDKREQLNQNVESEQ